MIFAIDWDRTIHDTDHPIEGRRLGPPIPGAKEALIALNNAGHHIIIHSCAPSRAIQPWMDFFAIPYAEIWEGQGKPIADRYVDDLALKFESWPQVLQELGITHE